MQMRLPKLQLLPNVMHVRGLATSISEEPILDYLHDLARGALWLHMHPS